MSYNELEHYGIKGMKWGIRRTPEQLGHKPSSSKSPLTTPKSLIDKGVSTKRKLAKDVLNRDLSVSQVRPRNRDSSATTLKKGSKVQHISGVPFDELRDDQVYVTSSSYDNKMYEAFLGMRLKSKGWDPRKVVMEIKTDVNAPSSKDQYKLFTAFQKDNKRLIKSSVNKWLKEKGKSESASDDPKELYAQFMNSLENKSLARKEFYRSLEKAGYNAVLDEHDVTGSWMQAEKPLIIMNALHTIGDFKVESLTNKKLEKALDEWLKQ